MQRIAVVRAAAGQREHRVGPARCPGHCGQPGPAGRYSDPLLGDARGPGDAAGQRGTDD